MEPLEQRLECPFNLDQVDRRFGTKDYVGAVMHPKYNELIYVFYQPNPKRELGHSEFFGLGLLYDGTGQQCAYVTKILGEEVEAYQWHTAIKCEECNELLVSLSRHDYRTCDCSKAMVDGGSAYLRCNAGNKIVKVNTITLEVQE